MSIVEVSKLKQVNEMAEAVQQVLVEEGKKEPQQGEQYTLPSQS